HDRVEVGRMRPRCVIAKLRVSLEEELGLTDTPVEVEHFRVTGNGGLDGWLERSDCRPGEREGGVGGEGFAHPFDVLLEADLHKGTNAIIASESGDFGHAGYPFERDLGGGASPSVAFDGCFVDAATLIE